MAFAPNYFVILSIYYEVLVKDNATIKHNN